MHLLAYKYHWGYSDLMNLPRTERKLFYDMVIQQLEAEQESINESNQANTSTSKYRESI